jgi:hypothetical protein
MGGDEGDAPAKPPPSDEHVKERAKKLEHGGEGQEDIEGDSEAAEKAAESILEESEERTFDPDSRTHEGGDVPRRSSDETA